MSDEFHIIFEKDEDWFIGYCPEVPGANGQGKTKEDCRKNVMDAADLIIQYLLEESWEG